MSRQLEILNGVALLITAVSLALMSLLAVRVTAAPQDCAARLGAGPSFAACVSARRW
jgi:hypothetical protein